MSRIVVGVDGSAHAERALLWAVREAELRSGEIELVYAYAIQPHAAVLGTSDRDRAHARMDQIVQRNKALLDGTKWSATVMPVLAGASSALIEVGENADLIVVGSRGLGGFKELYLGATSFRTAAHASTPVVVIPGGDDTAASEESRGIVVGVDGSQANRRALVWAFDEAQRRAVDVTVVHTYDVVTDLSRATVRSDLHLERHRQRIHDDAVAVLDEAVQGVGVPGNVAVQRLVKPGSAAAVLLGEAGADRLLVVGTRGHGVLGRMVFGSVSHQCLHHASGPVAVVP